MEIVKLLKKTNIRNNKYLAKRILELETKPDKEEQKRVNRECKKLLVRLLDENNNPELINSLLEYLNPTEKKEKPKVLSK